MKNKSYLIIILLLIIIRLNAQSILPNEFKHLLINDIDIPNYFIEILPESNLMKLYSVSDSLIFFQYEFKILNNISENLQWKNTYGVYQTREWLDIMAVTDSNSYGAISLDIPDKLDEYLQKNLRPVYIKGVQDISSVIEDTRDIYIHNYDMEIIFNLLDYRTIPVLIQHKREYLAQEKFYFDIAGFTKNFNMWVSSWENQEIDNYLSFYHSDFYSKSNNMDLDKWIKHKKRIFNRNDKIDVQFTNISYILKENYLYFEALQEYNADTYQDFGKKIIIWKYENDNWYIWAEDWQKIERPVITEEPPKPEIPLIVIEEPKPDSMKTVWELNKGKFPYEYINFLFPKLHNYDDYLIVVDKITQSAALYSMKNHFKEIDLYKTYIISSGQAEGNKWRRGDLKTPEGLYFTQRFIPDEELAPKYGTGAFTLNYPNQLDRLLKKTGYGIWLHGSDIGIIPFDTEGCVRFENDEIIYFKEILRLENTPVIINNEIKWHELRELQNEVDTILEFIDSWKNSWQEKNFESYNNFYSHDFHSDKQKMDYEQWYNHKKNVFLRNDQIIIDIYDFDYYYADGFILISFFQDYKAGNYRDFGKKHLVLKRNSNQWKIFKEEWQATARQSKRNEKGD